MPATVSGGVSTSSPHRALIAHRETASGFGSFAPWKAMILVSLVLTIVVNVVLWIT